MAECDAGAGGGAKTAAGARSSTEGTVVECDARAGTGARTPKDGTAAEATAGAETGASVKDRLQARRTVTIIKKIKHTRKTALPDSFKLGFDVIHQT